MARSRRNKVRRNSKSRRNRHGRRSSLGFESLEDRRLLIVTIPGTFDFFITDPGATDIDLGTDPGGDNPPLPPGFFGTIGTTPSDPFSQADIPLQGNPPVEEFQRFPPPLVIQWVDPHGNPVGPDSIHRVNQILVPDNTEHADTVVRRNDDVIFSFLGDAPTVDIEIVALSLQSVDPIVVTYGSAGAKLWDVFVTLDETATQPVGSMDLTSDTFVDGVSVSGSVDNLDLPVAFKVMFREVNNPGNVLVVPSSLATPTPPFGLPPAEFTNTPGTFQFPAPPVVVEKSDTLIQDNDGDEVADPGDVIRYSTGIGNFGQVDLTNVLFQDPHPDLTLVPGTLNVSPLVVNDTYTTFGNVPLSSTSLGLPGLLANDREFLTHTIGTDTLVTDFDATSAMGGTVSVGPDGSFTYEPPLGFSGSDTFTYTVTDPAGLVGVGLVDIDVQNLIWFIDSVNGSDAPSVGKGTLGAPFQTPSATNSISDPGDWIFVFDDGGAGTDGGFVLKDGQQLLGQGVPLQLGGTTFVPAAGRPTIGSPVSNAINLAADNTIRGLNVNSPSGAGIAGLNVGGLTIDQVNVTASGGSGVDLRNGSGVDINFDNLTVSNIANSGLTGVRFEELGGRVGIGGDTMITGVQGLGFAALGSANLDLDHGGRLVVSNIGSSGLDGVSIDLGSTSEVNFDGGLDITSVNGGDGLAVFSSGTISIPGIDSTINSAGGGAVIIDTQIGPLGVTFQSIQSGPSAPGTILFNTGPTGGLTILDGSPGDDVYNGGDGPDFLNGGPGEDQLDGGGNFDTAIFNGNQADYNIIGLAANSWQVQHIATGDVDSLNNIESLQFDDVTFPRPAGKGLSASKGSASDGAQRTAAALNSVGTDLLPTADSDTGQSHQAELELTMDTLSATVDAARARWRATGLSDAQAAALDSATFEITALSDWYIGAVSGTHIQIDNDGGGHGWFVDPTPADDTEFELGAPAGMDLMTTVLHELGHVVGVPDVWTTGNVMSSLLLPGQRLLPAAGQAAGFSPEIAVHRAYTSAPIPLGTLPPNEMLLVVFDATINALPPTQFQIANQATVTADGPLSVSSDDPATSAAGDPTLTTVDPVDEDFGSLPSPYPTLLADNGPRHLLGGPLFLGSCVDSEVDGQPSVGADGDNLGVAGGTHGACGIPQNDRDGVTIPTLVPGETTEILVRASVGGGLLNAWIDFDGNGDLGDSGEQIFVDRPLNAGVNVLPLTVPLNATPNHQSYARFRADTIGGLAFVGPATDGEVEDYAVTIQGLDFGDAPDPGFPTLQTNNGARHVLVGQPIVIETFTATGRIDHALPGTPSATGVGFSTSSSLTSLSFTPGAVTFQGQPVDFSGTEADWLASSASGTANYPATAGPATVTITGTGAPTGGIAGPGTIQIPAVNLGPGFSASSLDLFTGNTTSQVTDLTWNSSTVPELNGARVRAECSQFTVTGVDPVSGFLDWECAAGTILVPQVPFLGLIPPDADGNGQASPNADGDDTNGANDDDGVFFSTPLVACQTASVDVIASMNDIILNAWIDFNNNGSWSDAGEQIFTDFNLGSAGLQSLSFNVPCNAVLTPQTFARFRASLAPGLSFDGLAVDGEVEDHAVAIVGRDYGDLPDTSAGTNTGNYNTLATDSGPSHLIVTGLRMGAAVDRDSGTLQNAAADADDLDQAPDDEDGLVNPLSDLTLGVGAVPTVDVKVTNTSGSSATLYGWIDYNNDGVLANPTERAQIAVPDGTSSGTVTLTFPTVPTGFTGATYARFRLSTDLAAADPTGAAADGEVEDYPAQIADAAVGNVSFSLSSSSVGEIATAHTVVVTLNLTSGSTLTDQLDVTVQDAGLGTAIGGGVDYSFPPTTVQFPAGAGDGATQLVPLNFPPSANDLLVEGDEHFTLQLQPPVSSGADLISAGSGTHQVNIGDDDTAVLAIPASGSVIEASGTQTTDVTLSLGGTGTGPAALAVALAAEVADAGTGSATPGTDYVAFGSQPVAFPAGSPDGTTSSVVLQILNDVKTEPAETIDLLLQNLNPTLGGQASLGGTASTVTIIDDDPNFPPVLAPIGNQVSAPGRSSHSVNLSATDANGDPLLFSATVSQLEFFLDQSFDLSIHSQGLFAGIYGSNERWLYSFSSKLWYYILPESQSGPERLFQWDGTPGVLSGPFISNLNRGTHANPTILAEAIQAGVSASGNVITITKSSSSFGTVVVTAIVNDLKGGVASEVFQTTFLAPLPPAPPVLAPIGDRTSALGGDSIVINLSASDVNDDPLTFDVLIDTIERQTDLQLDLSLHSGGLFENAYFGGEKWLYSFSSEKWYYILPNRELYEWDGTPHVLSGTLIARMNPGTHANPALLYDAAVNPIPASFTLVGNVLTISKAAGFFGSIITKVTVDDGNGGQDSETFNARFVPAPRPSARSSNQLSGDFATGDLAGGEDKYWNSAMLDALFDRLSDDDLFE